jgi:hypothetical protein
MGVWWTTGCYGTPSNTHFAKEFWDMIGNQPHHLPGSWMDGMDQDEFERESLKEYVELNDATSFIWSEVEG